MSPRSLRGPCSTLAAAVLAMLGLDVPAQPDPLDAWLRQQAVIESWSADVVQIRRLESLAQELRAEGRVWFVQPNRFRWQLGEPPRTIAVRNGDELQVAYPRLQRIERYSYGGDADPALQQALALLEVGLPSEPQRFHERYELLSNDTLAARWRFELAPREAAARRLIERVVLEVARADGRLLATELLFPDGSRMRNEFSNHHLNAAIDEELFELSPSGASQ